jgi:cytochrome c oxidase subunit 2
MKGEGVLMRRLRGLISTAGFAVTAAMAAAQARADEIVGQPIPGAIGLQAAYSPLKHQAEWFHNLLLWIIGGIVLLVLVLLLTCIVRYNKHANPMPAKWSHNTPIEILWTLGPVMVLAFIAIFSFKLLFAYHDEPKPDLTVKVTGYQWYWGYAYPDQKIDEYTSNYLSEDAAKARGEPYLLAADNSMVVPVHKNIRVLVTGADVIHDFGVPAFGVKTDAVPGRTNETWFNADKPGIYYGQCDQLCGVNHAFMPIEIRVVTQPQFDAWVASKAPPPAPAAPQKVALNSAVAQH